MTWIASVVAPAIDQLEPGFRTSNIYMIIKARSCHVRPGPVSPRAALITEKNSEYSSLTSHSRRLR